MYCRKNYDDWTCFQKDIALWKSANSSFFGICAETGFFLMKKSQKMRKIEFLPIFSKFPQMFLKGVLGVWGVSGSSKRAILAYLKQWKLSRIGWKSTIFRTSFGEFQAWDVGYTFGEEIYSFGSSSWLTSLQNLLIWDSKITTSLFWCSCYHFLREICHKIL